MYKPDEKVLKEVANIVLSSKMKEAEPSLSELPAFVSKALRFSVDKDVNYQIQIDKNGGLNDIYLKMKTRVAKDDEPFVKGLSFITSAASLLKAGISELNIDKKTGLDILENLCDVTVTEKINE